MKKVVGIFLIILSILLVGGLSAVGYFVSTVTIDTTSLESSVNDRVDYIQSIVEQQGPNPDIDYALNGIKFDAARANTDLQTFNLLKYGCFILIILGFYAAGVNFFKGLGYLNQKPALSSSGLKEDSVNQITFDENAPKDYSYYKAPVDSPVLNGQPGNSWPTAETANPVTEIAPVNEEAPSKEAPLDDVPSENE